MIYIAKKPKNSYAVNVANEPVESVSLLDILLGDYYTKESPREIYHKKDEQNFKPLYCPELKEVRFCDPATIAWFEDGSKTVAVAGHGDTYDKEVGLSVCMLKRVLGNKKYREIMDKYCYKNEKDYN